MDTKPIKKLLRRYQGNLLSASAGELVRAFRLANGEMEKVINQAQIEYEEGRERGGEEAGEKGERGKRGRESQRGERKRGEGKDV